MGGRPAGSRERAQVTLSGRDVLQALPALQDGIAPDESPIADLLLGGIAYADDDFAQARRHWEQAYHRLRTDGDLCGAARAAINLADLHSTALGNRAAGRGWIGRATRLLDRVGHCVEWGYLALALTACDVSDISAVEGAAATALDLAIEFGDADLEVRALADSGFALVSQGRLREGFTRLDEAMAAISAGEVRQLSVAGKSFCAMLSACERTGDAHRGEEWTRLIGTLMVERFDRSAVILATHCQSAYGSVLYGVGRWREAEAAMMEALGPKASASVYHRVMTICRLADLRVLQGRLDEAAALLRPYEDQIAACAPLARLHLGRGEADLGSAVLNRGLRMIRHDHLRSSELLVILVEAELLRDAIAGAERAAARLEAYVLDMESPALRAEGALARGRILAARGEYEGAIISLQEAQRLLEEEERPVLCGTVRFELASALAENGDLVDAIIEAKASLTAFEQVGANVHVDRTTALLRRLGVRVPANSRGAAESTTLLSPREREVLNLIRSGLTNAEIGARLFITGKTAEHHVGRILMKLGARSRAEAAGMAFSQMVKKAGSRGHK